jgi:hypothetical protein
MIDFKEWAVSTPLGVSDLVLDSHSYFLLSFR